MRILGHRGAAARVTGNTLAGVEWALAHGADGVEADVRRTADGLLVCCREPSFASLGGPETPVVELDGAALAAIRLDGEHPVLRVDDLLDATRGRGRVVLEVKNIPGDPDFDAPREATARALASLLAGRAGDDVVVSSLDWFAIEAVREVAPGVRTAFLAPPGIDLDTARLYAADHGHEECHAHWSSVVADPAAVARAAEAGVAVTCWTVDDVEIARVLAAAGVDAVITNDPAALRAGLETG